MSDETMDDKITKSRNMIYYNQLMKSSQKKGAAKNKKLGTKKTSFSSKKVQLSDFAPVPEGWEYFAYAFYAIALPYTLGAAFLFLVVARGDYSSFMLLNMSAFPVVWLIGYEIVAVIMLIWILFLYLKHEDQESYY